MQLEDLRIHTEAQTLATRVYEEVRMWPTFDKDTLGRQLVRSCDSVAANIAEGFGRYSRSDTRRFLLYARGSLSETEAHVRLANGRGLITQERFDELLNIIEPLMKRIKAFGKSLSDTKS